MNTVKPKTGCWSALQIASLPLTFAPPTNSARPSKSGTGSTRVFLGSHADAFLHLLAGGQSGADGSVGLHPGAGPPRLAPAPATESRRLGTHLATPLAHPGSGSGVRSATVLSAHARRIRQNPARHCRARSGQVAGETQTYRARTILSAGNRALAIIRRRPPFIPCRPQADLSLVKRDPIPWRIPDPIDLTDASGRHRPKGAALPGPVALRMVHLF